MDLNLLIVWDALLREGSVQGAADRLHLSQPAVSRALARLRRATGDELWVRAGRAMAPTPYAEEMREQVRAAAETAIRLLSPHPPLDLATLDRAFVVCAHDAISARLITALIKRVAAEAPLVQLAFIAETSHDTQLLRDGAVDLLLDSGSPAGPGIRSTHIATATLQLVLRRDHPALDRALGPDTIGHLQFVTLSRRGQLFGRFDEHLRQDGLQRRVVASVPTVSAIIDAVAGSDLVALLPPEVCGAAMARNNVVAHAVPAMAETVPVVMSWHLRNDTDSAHTWLRDLTHRAWNAAGRAPAVSNLPGR